MDEPEGSSTASGGLVGRDDELALLAQVLETTTRTRRLGLVLVEGEDGIGKTALMAAFATQARAAGSGVMAGACLELGSQVPYLPFTEGLRGLLRSLPETDRAALLGPIAALLEPIVHPGVPTPVPPTPIGPSPSGVETIDMARLELFESLLRLAERLTARGPLVVILDDIHWADRATLDLVAFLARNLREAPLVIAMTARSGGGSGAGGPGTQPMGSYAASLDRHTRLDRIDLGPLGVEALGALLAADARETDGLASTPRIASALVRDIARRSGGNPLFALELRRWSARRTPSGSAAASGGTRVGAGTRGSASPITGSPSAASPIAGSPRLRDLVAARLALLPADARGVLRLASAAGRLVDDDLLCAATGLPAAQVSAGLRAAVAQGLLVPSETGDRAGYAFRHDLVREAVDAELLPGERARLHEAYAIALTSGRRRHVDHGELAMHWDAAGELERAYAAHVEAGMAARRVFAFADAQHHLDRALELWPRVPDADDLSTFDRASLLEAAAQAAALAGDHERAVGLAQALLVEPGIATPEDDQDASLEIAGRARDILRRSLWESGRILEALEAAEAAVAAAGPAATRVSVSAITHLAGLRLLTGDVRRARTLGMEAVELAVAGGWREEAALAGGIVGWSLVFGGRVAEGTGWIRRSWAAAQELGEPRGRAMADDNLARVLELAGRREEAARVAVAGAAAARRDGLGRTYGALLAAGATRLLWDLGRPAEAREELALGSHEEPVGPGQASLAAVAARLALDVDALDAAEAHLDGLRTLGGVPRDVDAVGWLLVCEVAMALRRANPAMALDVLRTVTSVGARAGAGDGGSQATADMAAPQPGADRTRASLVVLGAAVGPLLALGGQAVADRTLQLRATGAAPDAQLVTDRRRVDAMTAWLGTRPELAQAFAVDLAVARAELARADDPAGATAIAAWREVLAVATLATGTTGSGTTGSGTTGSDATGAAGARGATTRPAAAAYAALRLAEALVTTRDTRDEASAVLRAGIRAAAGAGRQAMEGDLRTLARRARLNLAEPGTLPGGGSETGASTATEGNPFGLTDRELEVLRLVAAGCTNREIGERLFMSPKTASVHVSAILAKLGVPGRLEAALVAQQVGLAQTTAAPGGE